MAKLRGVQIKKLKNFEAMEGITYQGDLWINGTKVGFWSQDGNGGPDYFRFEDGFSSDKFNKLCEETNEPHKYFDGTEMPYSAERFMEDLLDLTLDEKEYKSYAKKGYDMVIRAGSDHLVDRIYAFKDWSEDDAKKSICDDMKKYIDKLHSLGIVEELEYHVYKEPEDFIIGEEYTARQIAK